MWELDCEEGWAPKNWRFWTVVLEKTLKSPLDGKEIQPIHPKGNQSRIFIGIGLMLKLKLQYFGHLMWRTDSLEKSLPLTLGKTEGRRRWGWQRMRRLDCITNLTDMSLSHLQEFMMNSEAWHAAVRGVTKRQTWLSNWTQLNWSTMCGASSNLNPPHTRLTLRGLLPTMVRTLQRHFWWEVATLAEDS